MKQLWHISENHLKGCFAAFFAMPLLTVCQGDLKTNLFQYFCIVVSVITSLLFAFNSFKSATIRKMLGFASVISGYVSTLKWTESNPFLALTTSIIGISIIFLLIDLDFSKSTTGIKQKQFEMAKGGIISVTGICVASFFCGMTKINEFPYILSISLTVIVFLYQKWIDGGIWYLNIPFFYVLISLLMLFNFEKLDAVLPLAFVSSIILLVLLFSSNRLERLDRTHWWEVMFDHPARLLISTFLLLCILGTFLLSIPLSMVKNEISIIDAAFTSVSAVCVTGLIVLDTPNDFTIFGQAMILLLIQLGGLGIMTLTTVCLHAIGRRLSMKHERVLTSITNTDPLELIGSLKLILKFTFIAELSGAAILAIAFIQRGELPLEACWKGLFTSISAFCNAGFSLQTDSLIPYYSNPVILDTVSILIILGGMAPATCMAIPMYLTKKPVTLPVKIAILTTLILVISGTLLILAFEWGGVLKGMTFVDKLHNAFFQSVTLRTAGFNSVDIAAMSSPSFILMLSFMVIGGSPGGTAGGLKTTTVGLMLMTFWATITGKTEVVAANRRIDSNSIYKAVTIITSGGIIWLITIIMLTSTQQIPLKDLLFEATSAIGTVGLSTGATALLDPIGKIVIIVSMFAGRLGPMTLFMLLNSDKLSVPSKYPEVKIPLS